MVCKESVESLLHQVARTDVIETERCETKEKTKEESKRIARENVERQENVWTI